VRRIPHFIDGEFAWSATTRVVMHEVPAEHWAVGCVPKG
jgi:hypothetical protein